MASACGSADDATSVCRCSCSVFSWRASDSAEKWDFSGGVSTADEAPPDRFDEALLRCSTADCGGRLSREAGGSGYGRIGEFAARAISADEGVEGGGSGSSICSQMLSNKGRELPASAPCGRPAAGGEGLRVSKSAKVQLDSFSLGADVLSACRWEGREGDDAFPACSECGGFDRRSTRLASLQGSSSDNGVDGLE